MVYAVYRVLYGEDFIKESIHSILADVDKVFVFWDDTPWGDVKSCIYKGEKIVFPKKVDDVVEVVKSMACEKLELIYDHRYNNINQITNLVNERIIPRFEKPEIVVFIEPDHVFKEGGFRKALHVFKESQNHQMTTEQVEVWKGFEHIVPPQFRKTRLSVVFTRLFEERMPNTGRHSNMGPMRRIPVPVYNFGFAVSEKSMYWKIMIAIAMSQKIGDSPPNENWYEDKWLNWHEGIRGLEPAKGAENMIPMAVPHNRSDLPKSILNKINE